MSEYSKRFWTKQFQRQRFKNRVRQKILLCVVNWLLKNFVKMSVLNRTNLNVSRKYSIRNRMTLTVTRYFQKKILKFTHKYVFKECKSMSSRKKHTSLNIKVIPSQQYWLIRFYNCKNTYQFYGIMPRLFVFFTINQSWQCWCNCQFCNSCNCSFLLYWDIINLVKLKLMSEDLTELHFEVVYVFDRVVF